MKTSENMAAEIVAQYQAGRRVVDLVDSLGVRLDVIYAVLKKAGVTKSFSEAHRKYTLDQTVFEDACKNPEAAYWVGFLMADGCISNQRPGLNQIKLALAEKDAGHLEKFRAFVGSNAPVKISRNNRGYKGSSQLASLVLSSGKMIADLAKYGVLPRKSKTAEVKLLQGNPHFWRGCIDGDGWVGFQGNGRHCPLIGFTGGERIVQQFVEFVDSTTCWKNPLIVQPNNGIWKATVAGRRAKLLADVLYGVHGPRLERKGEKAKTASEWVAVRYDRSELTLERLSELKAEHGTWKSLGKFLGTSGNSLAVLYMKRKRGGQRVL